MTAKSLFRLVFTTTVLILIGLSGCDRDINTLAPASYPTDAEIFIDGFGPAMEYQAFGGSKVDAFDVDDSDTYDGDLSMRITVPSFGDPAGSFAGGAFISTVGRDLTGYDALTFWAKASTVATIDLVGFGNDNSGASLFSATRSGVPVTTSWKKYVVPIPLAAKLSIEGGLFQYAEGPENGVGYDLWFDEVQFEKLGTIAQPRAVISSTTVTGEEGETFSAGVTGVTYNVNGEDVSVDAAPAYFTLISSDPAVAETSDDGKVTGVSVGTAEITVKLGSVEMAEKITVNVVQASPRPASPAPVPTIDAANVISMFSNAYTNVTVDTWDTGWQFSDADVVDIQVAGDDIKKYTNLNFVGIEFATQTIDASMMTNFHLDIWTPDPTAAPATFKVLLIDFGADGVFDGGDDSSHELTFTSPVLATESWVSLDIPLSDFTGLTGRGHLAQLVLSGEPNTVYVDNVYFHNTGGSTPTGPTVPAPTPTVPAADVISLFSNAYSDEPVDTWNAGFSQANLDDIQVQGNDTKLYTGLAFAGVEFTSQTIDVTMMTGFHIDIWTPDPTALPAAFKVKLVDFGPDNTFDGGDDTEQELSIDANSTPALGTGSWIGIDIPMSSFTGLTTRSNLAQLIISGDPNTVYVDNVYFYKQGGGNPTEPAAPAPTPTFDAADVISLYSNAYTDVTVNTWSAEWDNADVGDVLVAGDDAKLYTNLVFAGIEFTSPTINADAMTHFSMDIWTPDDVSVPAVFKIKLVDFGADGVFDGGDDVEFELTFDENSTPPLVSGQWVTFDIPLSDFTGLVTREHLAQMIIVGDPGPNTVWVDNVLLHK
ncbi:MAG: hypothetical protein ACRBF0_08005 [Calditrichia bacterium]